MYSSNRPHPHWTEDELSLVHPVAERLAIGMAQAELFEMVAQGKVRMGNDVSTRCLTGSSFLIALDVSSGLIVPAQRWKLRIRAPCWAAIAATFCAPASETSTCVVEKAIEEGQSVTIEVTPDRLNRPILVSIEPVLDKAGAVTAAVCTARDLSELRKVQAVAREHQSLLTNILESARESIYAVDMDGRFKWCNSATLGHLGLSAKISLAGPCWIWFMKPIASGR